MFKYYLKHEHECFIRYKTRGAAERFIADKARIASVLNSLENDPFYTHLVTLFTKEFSVYSRCCTSWENRGKRFVKMY